MKWYGRLCLVLAMAASCLGCQSKEKDPVTVPALTQNMRTHCVGRFLVDLPQNFRRTHVVAGGTGDATFYYGHDADFRAVNVTVIAQPVTSEQFDAAVTGRADELASGINYETNASMLLGREAWSPTQVRLSSYASVDIADAQVHELHVLVGDAHVAINTTAFEPTQIPDAERRLRNILAGVSKVDAPEHAGPGVCLGPVVVDAGSDYEELQLSYRVADRAHSDLRFQVSLNTFRQPDDEPSLIARGESNLAGLGVRPKALQKGKRQLAGLEGEQWLGRFEEDGRRQHGFYAETGIRSPSPQHPKLMLELFTGGEDHNGHAAESSLDDEQAIALWDRIVASLRVRPGA
ncbi:T6SS immunity protein Tli4 family protein [Luteimonas sp. R10]|uniref:T6SS immunity protein Tli4 family protein n=1 Tax=Luteimonas sp. R10 TaxID=3108176 RepID=UPI0030852285|nr:T6SS immunity protein Tli4 family protein [Luteimonas sp. R10]